jgi:hypothetical protein
MGSDWSANRGGDEPHELALNTAAFGHPEDVAVAGGGDVEGEAVIEFCLRSGAGIAPSRSCVPLRLVCWAGVAIAGWR